MRFLPRCLHKEPDSQGHGESVGVCEFVCGCLRDRQGDRRKEGERASYGFYCD